MPEVLQKGGQGQLGAPKVQHFKIPPKVLQIAVASALTRKIKPIHNKPINNNLLTMISSFFRVEVCLTIYGRELEILMRASLLPVPSGCYLLG